MPRMTHVGLLRSIFLSQSSSQAPRSLVIAVIIATQYFCSNQQLLAQTEAGMLSNGHLQLLLNDIALDSTVDFWSKRVRRDLKEVEGNPADAELLLRLGISYIGQEMPVKANATLTKAIQADPSLQKAHVFRGIIRERLADVFELTSQTNPDHIAEIRQGALRDYNNAVIISASEPFVFAQRAGLYVTLGRFQDAIEDLNIALDLHPTCRRSLEMRGVLYLRIKKFDAAMLDIETAIYWHPYAKRLYAVKASAHQEMGQHDLAVEAYNVALSAPGNEQALLMERAISLEKIGQHEKAEADRTRARQLEANKRPVEEGK